jgi:hypothetical protein
MYFYNNTINLPSRKNTTWDQNGEQMPFLLVTWLHDQSPETLTVWKEYYVDNRSLNEFLSTLDVRNYNNTDKLAWEQILIDVNARGWEK